MQLVLGRKIDNGEANDEAADDALDGALKARLKELKLITLGQGWLIGKVEEAVAGEHVVDAFTGKSDGHQVLGALTTSRLVVRGMKVGALGKKVGVNIDVPVGHITIAEVKRNALLSEIMIRGSGFAYEFEKVTPDGTRFTEAIRKVAAAPASPLPAPTPSTGGGDLGQQLAQLAQLYKDGALTDDEFVSAKARLLGG